MSSSDYVKQNPSNQKFNQELEHLYKYYKSTGQVGKC